MHINEASQDDLRRSLLGNELLMGLVSYLWNKPKDETPTTSIIFGRPFVCISANEMSNTRGIFHDVMIAITDHHMGDPSGSVTRVTPVNGIRYIIKIFLHLDHIGSWHDIYAAMCANDRRDTFRHEAQHILDIKRYHDKEGLQSTTDLSREEYFNSPLELNAFFHNIAEPVLSHLRFLYEHPIGFEFFTRLPDDYRAFLSYRIAHLTGSHRSFWDHLTDVNKKRVISRLKKLYDLYIDTCRIYDEKHKLTSDQENAIDAALNDSNINTNNA